jgi:GT2 family glycosyltransferase
MCRSATVVVCTRDRPDDLARALASLTAIRTAGCRVLVVDQSSGPETHAVVREVASRDERVEYLASGRTGLSASRNDGAALATGELVLFTDDDCEVGPDWVDGWCEFFASQPAVAIAFGLVSTPSTHVGYGYIPQYDPGPGTSTWGRETLRHGAGWVGMGANMALRRAAWSEVGGFDEMLGAGARFPGAEETDIALRIVGRGNRLGHVANPAVIHYGQREPLDASRLVKGYRFGTGAMYAKHVRCGDWHATAAMGLDIARLGLRVAGKVVTGRRPTDFNSLRSFFQGIEASRALPVDTERRIFLPAPAEPSHPVANGAF